jgi:hypothetical protein
MSEKWKEMEEGRRQERKEVKGRDDEEEEKKGRGKGAVVKEKTQNGGGEVPHYTPL